MQKFLSPARVHTYRRLSGVSSAVLWLCYAVHLQQVCNGNNLEKVLGGKKKKNHHSDGCHKGITRWQVKAKKGGREDSMLVASEINFRVSQKLFQFLLI